MKYLFLIIVMMTVKLGFACECEAKPNIDILDWNDSDVIFTATLTQFDNKDETTNLTFLISEIFKGKVNKKAISYSINKVKDHNNTFHHIDTIFVGQKWIIFSSNFTINNEISYMLKESNESHYCILSRPILDNDSYLSFINKISQDSNNRNKSYYKNKATFAQGSLENKIPVGIWKYFNRNDLDHYWEGKYVNGKREGKWIQKTINSKKEKVVINEDIYDNGILKEQIKYNFINEKIEHNIYSEKGKQRIIYHKNTISSKWVYNKILNITTIEKYKDGKPIYKTERIGLIF